MRSPADADRAFGRTIQAADQIQQSGFARTGRPHQREEFAGGNLHVQVGQNMDVLRAAMENFFHALDLHQRAGV